MMGTFGGALEARQIDACNGKLTAEVTGEGEPLVCAGRKETPKHSPSHGTSSPHQPPGPGRCLGRGPPRASSGDFCARHEVARRVRYLHCRSLGLVVWLGL